MFKSKNSVLLPWEITRMSEVEIKKLSPLSLLMKKCKKKNKKKNTKQKKTNKKPYNLN